MDVLITTLTLRQVKLSKMAAKVQRIATHAFKTFSNKPTRKHFCEQWKALQDAVNQVSASDLNLNSNLVKNKELYSHEIDGATAPVTYVHIWEDSVFSMGIFVLRNGARLPMHDHPGMYGVLKVIHGAIRLRSFSPCAIQNRRAGHINGDKTDFWGRGGERLFASKKCSDGVYDVDSDACVLTPSDANLHEIEAVNGPAAFLDVLAPPYDPSGGRECHYYKEYTFKDQNDKRRLSPSSSSSSSTDGHQQEDITWLVETSHPDDFWCDSSTYQGPAVNPRFIDGPV